ncbi:MAG: polymer-forming cytoskeletal protein [Chloroflexi bacterium AL-W]|nr:polymer-forming cytoskeletal protein [Chloroflexi bacterium AL-N1]NOK69652.1 polymer-forming cytoskeletal protein [Chloroflexi bacterium AL-N10]NOK72199.1 polymer-forming cytoskeletal protein [Chloroflexi bacterium AL-N5]NOK85028.1 polymer-forming cytoskeletal protein [Chloroflexi bacterium AL-W]NOK91781.1 polymer-forming cytoskeletal protein [Chloroflexi bacterium AL-N15]
MFGRRESQQVPNLPHKEEQHIDLTFLPSLADITSPETGDTTLEDQLAQAADNTEVSPEMAPSTLPKPTLFAPATLISDDIHPFSSEQTTTATKSVAESVIGPDDFFDGTYRSERGVRIQGSVRGSIESQQYIFVEAGAQVEACLSAEEITVAGSFHGNIGCRQRLIITHSGKIHGKVQTKLLLVQEGGILDGELHMLDIENASIS